MYIVRPSAIDLINYTVIEEHIRINPRVASGEVTNQTLRQLGVDDLQFHIHHEGPADSSVLVSLTLSTKEDESTVNLGYFFSLGMFGQFTIKDDVLADAIDQPELMKFLICNCANILYGAAREKIFTATSRMPPGGFILPVMVLHPQSNEDSH